MIRILVFILVIVAAALGLAWFADQPGSITVQWLGYEIKTSAFVGALVLIGIAAVLILAWALLRFILTRPAAMSAYFQERRRSQGFEALTRGLLAVGVGDRAQAQRYAGMARRNLPNEPLTALLKAQAAQLKGDRATARRAFEGMLDRPETELLGLRGLYLEAKRSDNTNAARVIAEQVVKRDPELAWSVNALFDMQARAGDWEGALNTLAIARQHGNVEADVALRRRAALLTAEARDLEASAPAKALALANEALRLAPSLVPAAEIAGRLLASKGDSRQASRLIARTWKLAPHPDLALVYAFANPGDSPRERLKRVKHLASLTPGDIEGQIAIAMAAIEARDWREAEAALSPYLQDRPPARVCTLMARIEAGEGNKGREREWLARAVRAPRDRAWIADGYVSDRWLPVSPVTGAVNAFEWKAPIDAIGKGDDTLLIEEGLETPEPPPPPPRVVSPPAQIEDQAPSPAEPPTKSLASSGDGASPPRVPVVEIKPAEPAPEVVAPKPPRQDLGAPPRREPELYVPPRPPDDPGIGPADPDESPASLERLRTAQIR
jgi:HemY protein